MIELDDVHFDIVMYKKHTVAITALCMMIVYLAEGEIMKYEKELEGVSVKKLTDAEFRKKYSGGVTQDERNEIARQFGNRANAGAVRGGSK